jgi:DNA-binding FadR family transcriptional regulator
MARTNLNVDLISAIAPVERETLNDRVYRELKNSIMAGSLKPGSELTLRSVADALGTSLMPVRDAMRRLVSERALEVLPSRRSRYRFSQSTSFSNCGGFASCSRAKPRRWRREKFPLAN